jgi:hypothetical protein
MKTNVFAMIAAAFSMAGCGNSSTDGEMIGQAKRLTNVTPLLCMNYPAFDLSLGVMQNGTGSMSTQDIWFTVVNPMAMASLRTAVDSGSIVRVVYDERRFAPCSEDHWLKDVEIVR